MGLGDGHVERAVHKKFQKSRDKKIKSQDRLGSESGGSHHSLQGNYGERRSEVQN